MTLSPIGPALAPFVCDGAADNAPPGRGRPRRGAEPVSALERKREQRAREHGERLERIAILDTETPPFDNKAGTVIFPFLAVLYSDHFEPVIIWDENRESFTSRLLAAIEALDGYTIYAHNGGKFDYLFLVHRLRGFVSFKGRGIMSARIGNNELRDSFHIIPEKLATYKKDDFDYSLLTPAKRNRNRETIITYCINDCRYLLAIVKKFIADHGLKLSIGQAAMAKIKEHYTVANLTEHVDAFLRNYFFGGRVECLAGMGVFEGDYKLYDVNSMYPKAMNDYLHPIGKDMTVRLGEPGPFTVFVDLTCDNNGALVTRTEDGETSASVPRGRFRTSIWEYNVARKYGLIRNITIHNCIDFYERSTFEQFVTPLYEKRQLTKRALKELEPGTAEHDETKKDDIFYKLLLNNGYGKFAQNPRRFKETFITAYGERPPETEEGFGALPVYESEELGYAIWERPQARLRFHNVATAASITGAARSILLEAICNAVDPIYCDTDSLICRELRNTDLHPERLGAWDLEDEFVRVAIAGKKMYSCERTPERAARNKGKLHKAAAKGSPPLPWQDYVDMIQGAEISVTSMGVTMTKRGDQFYMTRRIKATAAPPNALLREFLKGRDDGNGDNGFSERLWAVPA